MANTNKKPVVSNSKLSSTTRKISGNLNSLLDQLHFTVNGSPRIDDIDTLDSRFNSIMTGEIDSFSKSSGDNFSSFIAKLFDADEKQAAFNPFSKQSSLFADNGLNIQGLFTEAYKNRLIKQNDLHEVSSQLIELREAILVTRDAITSSDIVDGQMSRTISFGDSSDNETNNDYIPLVKDMEEKFDLQKKIKNFIVPKTLEYGDYYVYRIPYSKLFEDFMAAKDETDFYNTYNFTEKTLLESVEDTLDRKSCIKSKRERDRDSIIDDDIENILSVFKESGGIDELCNTYPGVEKLSKKKAEDLVKEDIKNMMGRISVCNDPVPLNIIEEGVSSVYEYFKENKESFKTPNEFQKAMQIPVEDGVFISQPKDSKRSRKHQFSNIKDCYIKLIEPTRLLPVKLMDKIIGYYYIQDENVSPISGVISSNMYANQFDLTRKDRTIVDAIAIRIVKAFDKKFLQNNIKFKDTIVEALNYYNINEKKIKFQFIPVEYISSFKVNEDVNGDGTSMIEPSLFYAKLYLILLLFKMLSILQNSNDTKVNYIRSSGIDKNIRNKIEEIARSKQNRQINIMDLFNYTSVIKKVGNGSEMYIPVGKGNERGIETEILSGQEIQLNSDLLDMLRNQFILGTGVPSAILNYLNEADFAKSLEMANTKFLGRVVSYQIDFNSSITELYKYLMRESTTIPENIIETFHFSFAQPKSQNAQIKQELIQNFDAYANWAIGIFQGDQGTNDPDNFEKVREFKLSLIEDQLPMINVQELKKIAERSEIYAIKEKLKPQQQDNDEMGGEM